MGQIKTKGRGCEFKCIYCVKFISYKDIDDGKIGHKFTPDTEFTVELNEFWHLKCVKTTRYEENKD